MKDIRVTGIMEASNEFPLILLSITHALYYHVDDIILLNHNTDDATISGMRKLKLLFPNRIRVISYSDDDFFQEAATNILLEITNDSDNHWAWVFDADEFLITKDMKSLKKYIEESDEFDAIHLPVYNFVSLNSFNEYELDEYLELTYCSEPMVFNDISVKIISQGIKSGYLNYFDFPFASKIIFKYNYMNWIAAGSHFLKYPPMQNIRKYEEKELYTAHLPLLTYRRLWHKAIQGKKLIMSGFPEFHGWQSQMLYHLSTEGKMEEFWSAHSIQKGSNSDINYTINYDLSNSLKPICNLLRDAIGGHFEEGRDATISSDDVIFDFRMGTHVVRKFQAIADFFVNNINDNRKEVERLNREVERLNREVEKRNNIITEEKNINNALLHSKSWLITKPLRLIFLKIRSNIHK